MGSNLVLDGETVFEARLKGPSPPCRDNDTPDGHRGRYADDLVTPIEKHAQKQPPKGMVSATTTGFGSHRYTPESGRHRKHGMSA